VMSHDDNRNDGNFARGANIPAEMIPDTITSEDVRFAIGSRADEANNALGCKGQTIDLPAGDYTRLYILAAAAGDTHGDFVVDGKSTTLDIQRWTGYVGQFYNRQFALDGVTVTSIDAPYAKHGDIAWFSSHIHQEYQSENLAYQYGYLYKYQINIPKGARHITLPKNMGIKVIAMTVTDEPEDSVTPLQPLYDDFKDSHSVPLR